jgi:hypothetical protein
MQIAAALDTRVWASRKPSRRCGHSATRVPPELLHRLSAFMYLSSVFVCVRYMNFISPAEARDVPQQAMNCTAGLCEISEDWIV